MTFELGLYLPCNHRDPLSPDSRVYPEMLEQAQLAEEIGFNAFAIPEHHFQEGLVVPSSLMLAVRVAAMTKSARVRTAVIPLPIHHPLRLAGEITLADHLTEGRLEIGLARGSFEYTFRRFKMTMDQSHERFLESVEVLERLLTETNVVYDGKYVRVDEPTTIMPRPRQLPRPRFWIGGVSRDSITWAVSKGYSVFTTPLREPLELLRKQSDWFHSAVEELGSQPGSSSRPELQLLTQVFASKDKREIDRAMETILQRQRRSARMLETAGEVKGGKVVLGEQQLSRDDIEDALIIGGPEEVIEGILMRKDLGFSGIQLDMGYHLPDHAAVIRSLEHMRDEVIPAVLP